MCVESVSVDAERRSRFCSLWTISANEPASELRTAEEVQEEKGQSRRKSSLQQTEETTMRAICPSI